MNPRLLSTRNIIDSQTLGATVRMLNEFQQSLVPDQLNDADIVNDLIVKNFGNDIFKMRESEKLVIINKMHMVLIYLAAKQQELDQFTPEKDFTWEEKRSMEADFLYMSAIAQAIKTQCISSLISDDNHTLSKLDDYLERTYESFKKKIADEPLTQHDLSEARFNFDSGKKDEDKLFTQPFTFAREKLEKNLKEASKVSGLMHYIYGADESGLLKTNEGVVISSLEKKLNEISAGTESEKEKLMKLEQAVLDIYWQVRISRGVLPSKLGNVLESFLKNELELEKKYGYLARIPHSVNGMSKQAFQLSEIREAQGTSIQKEIEQLDILLSKQHLKTKRGEQIKELKSELQSICDDDSPDLRGNKPDEHVIARRVKLAICKKYIEVQGSANSRWFFHHSNLADALKDYIKNTYNMDVAKIHKFVADNTLPKKVELRSTL